MKLAASNIGWEAKDDDAILSYMANHGFHALEIAPTRWFPTAPYEQLSQAQELAREVKEQYGLSICSMQSIWYGMTQRVAESEESRLFLYEYTKQAVHFADAVGCTNLVFGCPRNRSVRSADEVQRMEDFLFDCGEYASKYGVVLAIEPNPTIYNTNYLNTTREVIALLKKLNCSGLGLNLDFGTVIANQEPLDWIRTEGHWIHHVHISEPRLVPVVKRAEHGRLIQMLHEIQYNGYLSLEMAASDSGTLLESLRYLSRAVNGNPVDGEGVS